MKIRRAFTLFIVFIMLVFSCQIGFAEPGNYLHEAEQLKRLNVFKGSESGFELTREPTRLEGGIMFVKLLGAEEEALVNNYPHPFVDVPDWGSAFVGYLYKMGYTSGTSATTFGSNDKMQAKSYLTFLLRALGYDDKNGDFTWNEAIAKAKEINMINAGFEATLNSEVFLRDHLAKISLDALKTSTKNSEGTLAKKLVDQGAITQDIANEMNLLTPANTRDTMAANNQIMDIMQSIGGVKNYVDLNGIRYYRPLTEQELKGIGYDSLDTMDIYHNEYTLGLLKSSYPNMDWDQWLKIKWGKFDWNDQSHGVNLSMGDYWEDYDGNTAITAGTYAASLGLRVATEAELKALFNSLSVGLNEDLGWPSGYFWASDISSEGPDYHRFVQSLNGMGEQYNDTRDYLVILVGEADTSKAAPAIRIAAKWGNSSNSSTGIHASSEKLAGMTDIPGVANSISIDGVLIYRPLTTDEITAILGANQYDYSLTGAYGYSAEKTDAYSVTLSERKAELYALSPSVDWDMWLGLQWPLYDNSADAHAYGPGDMYEGDYRVHEGDVLSIYADRELAMTPKYLFDKLYDAYPNGRITSEFGWPANFEYITSSRDEFGNVYTTNLEYQSSSIHLGYYDPCYISLVNYADIEYEKLTESSVAQ